MRKSSRVNKHLSALFDRVHIVKASNSSEKLLATCRANSRDPSADDHTPPLPEAIQSTRASGVSTNGPQAVASGHCPVCHPSGLSALWTSKTDEKFEFRMTDKNGILFLRRYMLDGHTNSNVRSRETLPSLSEQKWQMPMPFAFGIRCSGTHKPPATCGLSCNSPFRIDILQTVSDCAFSENTPSSSGLF